MLSGWRQLFGSTASSPDGAATMVSWLRPGLSDDDRLARCRSHPRVSSPKRQAWRQVIRAEGLLTDALRTESSRVLNGRFGRIAGMSGPAGSRAKQSFDGRS